MKNIKRLSILVCLTLLFSIYGNVWLNKSHAAEVAQSTTYKITQEQQSMNLPQGYTLQVDNQSPFASYRFVHSGSTALEKKLQMATVEQVVSLEVAGQNYILISEREAGSGAYLHLHLYLLGDQEVKEVFTSDKLYPQADVSVSNDQLKVTYPIFADDQPQAAPLSIKEDDYLLQNGTVTLQKTVAGTEKKEQDDTYKIKATNTNPSWKEISDYLTTAAIAHNIPPEIVKAIAWQESAWQQFWTSDPDGTGPKQVGDPVIGFDGRGLGIMQITLAQSYLDSHPGLENDLKYDWKKNIDYGVQILDDKWGYGGVTNLTPTINDNDKKNLVNWYFAIMAYNGFSKINDPHFTTYTPYQDLIYAHMKKYGLIDVPEVQTADLDVYYNTGSSRMYFNNKMHYTIDQVVNSKYAFSKGQTLQINTASVGLKSDHEANANVVKVLNIGDRVTVLDAPTNPSDRFSHFTYYPVSLSDGTIGYVESAYLTDSLTNNSVDNTSGQTSDPVSTTPSSPTVQQPSFSDLKKGSYGYDQVAALNKKNIIFGFSDDSFRPEASLTRLQAALMFVRALHLDTPNVKSTGFNDIKVGSEHYKEMAAIKKAGIFDGDGNGNFNPNQILTRGQMAKVLCVAFDLQHKSSYTTPFSDVKNNIFQSYIETLYGNHITSGLSKTTYGVDEKIKRVDFSIFLYKVI
ncbi:hypothetical protein GCM10011391_37120 [Pullulanibacillus camelliae]|uniref:SLH domain-containing protein n=1 Tax=Pullulanibacillus camelliae TaxID=1707096 RepID=A0A8J2YN13_9BACL|nr:S-layer homology domain-containing protein [Pullulanibacillus camelliae]GGE54740.1 hypothetical protein GCM10011391_37120 [Pullulanibacillus camelliae]